MEVIRRLRRGLRDTRGHILLTWAFLLLVFCLLFAAFLEVSHVWTTVNTVKGKVNEAVLAACAVNVANVYHGVRESEGQARMVDSAGGDWSYPVDTEAVLAIMTANMGYDRQGDTLVKRTRRGGEAYTLSGFTVRYRNETDGLHFLTDFIIEIPLRLGAGLLPPVTLHMEVQSTYEAKF